MGFIPANYFVMGAAHGPAPAAPEHPVLLSPYYMDLQEVSNANYHECVENGDCTPPQQGNSFTRMDYYGNPRFAEFPVVHVTWQQAHEFCEAAGKRLPTEAEWEFAASGVENYHWPWGNTFEPERVTVAAADTQPVDSYPTGQSPFGMLNMAGNVAEWVADAYIPSFYANSPASNPVAEDPLAPRVYRGGSFGNPDEAFYATSYRYRKSPFYHDVDIGFRCAMTALTEGVDNSFPNALVDEFCMAYLAYKPNGKCP
jgi:formylglycine-generating enzyme